MLFILFSLSFLFGSSSEAVAADVLDRSPPASRRSLAKERAKRKKRLRMLENRLELDVIRGSRERYTDGEDETLASFSAAAATFEVDKTVRRSKRRKKRKNVKRPRLSVNVDRTDKENIDQGALTPYSREALRFEPLRHALAREIFEPGTGNKQGLPSPRLREILDTHFPSVVYRSIVFQDEDEPLPEIFYIPEGLFNFDDSFLTYVRETGEYGGLMWLTNRERLLLGQCPIGYKGKVPEDFPKQNIMLPETGFEGLTEEQKKYKIAAEIIQNDHRLEWHHLDQKGGSHGVVLMYKGLHKGDEYPFCISYAAADSISIVEGGALLGASATKKEKRRAKKAAKKRSVKRVSDVLHPLKEDSRINRDSWTSTRTRFNQMLGRTEVS